MSNYDKLKECISSGFICDRSYLGCFNTSLRGKGCTKCINLMLEEHDAKVRKEFVNEMKEKFFHQVGTQFDEAILEMEKLANEKCR